MLKPTHSKAGISVKAPSRKRPVDIAQNKSASPGDSFQSRPQKRVLNTRDPKVLQKLFHKPYFKARSDFRNLAATAINSHGGGKLEAIQVPNEEGLDLSVDCLILPAKTQTKNVLYISSGVHGSEAPPGSAMEELFLRENLADLDLSNTTLVMVHSYNPWGHFHQFRNAGNNIDPNRNNPKTEDGFEQYPKSDYHLVKSAVTSDSPPPPLYLQSIWSAIASTPRTFKAAGFDTGKIVRAVAEGQIEDPKGPSFAGSESLPQRLPLLRLLQPHLGSAERILHLDIHTGLGKRGVLHLINLTDEKDRERAREFAQALSQKNDIRYADSDMPGFYDTSYGDFTNNTELLAQNSAQVLCLTAEVGTLGSSMIDKLEAGARSKERNQLHFYPEQTSAEKKRSILTRSIQQFDPQDNKWRSQVVDNFRTLWAEAIDFCASECSN